MSTGVPEALASLWVFKLVQLEFTIAFQRARCVVLHPVLSNVAAFLFLRVLKLIVERGDAAFGVSHLRDDNLFSELTGDLLCDVQGRRHEGGSLLLVAILQGDCDFLLRHGSILLHLGGKELVEVSSSLCQEGRLLLEFPLVSKPLNIMILSLVTRGNLRTFALFAGMLVFLYHYRVSQLLSTDLFFYFKYNQNNYC